MANVPYSGDGQTVLPDTRAPDDYSRVQASPEMFGGSVARGLDQLGQGASKAAQFYGQVAADDATNTYQDQATKLLTGDPTKQVLQPDGTMAPDTGYFGMRGAAAMSARAGVEAQLDDLRKQARAGLSTPESQLQFDTYTRRLRSMQAERIGNHADTQFNTYAGTVNKATADLSIQGIAANPFDDQSVASHTADLIQSRVKAAQLAGGGPELLAEANTSARRDALQTRVEAIGATNPVRALEILDGHRELAGTSYEPLRRSFQSRAEAYGGRDLGASKWNDPGAGQQPAQPGSATAEQVHASIINQESGGRPGAATSVTGARGIGQIQPATFQQYAKPGESISNPADNLAVSRRITDDYYRRFGGDPARVAVAYFSGPGNVAPAGSPTPYLENKADPTGKTTASYVSDITRRLGRGGGQPLPVFAGQGMNTPTSLPQPGTLPPPAPPAMPDTLAPAPGAPQPSLMSDATATPPAPPAPAQQPAELSLEERRASAVRAIQASGQSLEVQAHAVAEVNRLYQEQTFAQDADTKSKRDRNEKAMGTYTTQVLSGNVPPDILHRVAVDPNLQPETKWTLTRAIQSHMEAVAGGKDDRTLGPGYHKAIQGISASPDDPNRISDPATLMHMVNTGDLTLEGFNKVRGLMTAGERSSNDQAANSARAHLLDYAKSKLSFQEDTGPMQIKDPAGQAIFNARFVPKFEAAYDHWVKAGKDPMEFLDQKNVDKMLVGMRSKSEMDASRIAAGLDPLPGDTATPAPTAAGTPPAAAAPAPAAPAQPLPAAPPATNPEQWPAIVQRPPLSSNGKPWPYANWARVLSTLKANPSDENRRHFDEAFGPAGYHAAEVLQRLEPLNPMGAEPSGAL